MPYGCPVLCFSTVSWPSPPPLATGRRFLLPATVHWPPLPLATSVLWSSDPRARSALRYVYRCVNGGLHYKRRRKALLTALPADPLEQLIQAFLRRRRCRRMQYANLKPATQCPPCSPTGTPHTSDAHGSCSAPAARCQPAARYACSPPTQSGATFSRPLPARLRAASALRATSCSCPPAAIKRCYACALQLQAIVLASVAGVPAFARTESIS